MWVRRSRAQSVLGSSYHLDPAKRNHEFESNPLRQPVSCFSFSWLHSVETSLFPRIMWQFPTLQAGVILSGAEKQSESVGISLAG